MASWHSYPSIYALGHRAVTELLFDPVVVEEKIDGSQFSFGRFDGELKVRSRGHVMEVDAPEKLFTRAVDAVRDLPLREGWTYRAEYLAKPKHNTLAYDRVPRNHLIIFDINPAEENYLSWLEKSDEAERLGFEVVPLLHEGNVADADFIRGLLEHVSVLGGQRIEGVVIKNYRRFGADKKALMGKYVSEAFKEIHAASWKVANPQAGDIIDLIVGTYRSPARWDKAVQHLREDGRIENSPRDIGPLMKEVWPDIVKECEGDMRNTLWGWAEDKIRRGVTRGLPEWYKQKLLDSQFEGRTNESDG